MPEATDDRPATGGGDHNVPGRTWPVTGPDGVVRRRTEPGTLGGNARSRLYGRLDCPSALRALPRGVYQRTRVFFASEADATGAGYRPCAVCLPDRYRAWKAAGDA